VRGLRNGEAQHSVLRASQDALPSSSLWDSLEHEENATCTLDDRATPYGAAADAAACYSACAAVVGCDAAVFVCGPPAALPGRQLQRLLQPSGCHHLRKDADCGGASNPLRPLQGATTTFVPLPTEPAGMTPASVQWIANFALVVSSYAADLAWLASLPSGKFDVVVSGTRIQFFAVVLFLAAQFARCW